MGDVRLCEGKQPPVAARSGKDWSRVDRTPVGGQLH